MYQLPLARHYLEQQSLVLHEYVRFGLFPQNINLLMVVGLLFGDATLAQLFCTLPLFVMALGLMGVSQHFSGQWLWGAITGLLLFILQPVRETLGYAYVDNGLALFCFAASLALACWYEKHRQSQGFGWVLISAILAGTAAGSKLFGGVFVALLGIYLVFSSRDIKTVLWFSLLTLITGVGWYLRSFIISGDPVHPAGGPYFGYFLWDAVDLASQYGEQKTFGVTRNLLYLPLSLWTAGVVLWVLAFVSLCLTKVPRLIRMLQVIFILYFLFWFYVSQVDRYLSPIYGVGMALSAYTLSRGYYFLEQYLQFLRVFKRPAVMVLSGGLTLLLFVSGVFYQYRDRDIIAAIERRVDYLFNYGDREKYNNRPGVQLFLAADKHINQYGSRLMQLGFENAVYFFSGVTIGDWYGVGRYRDRVNCNNQGCTPLSPKAMKQQLKSFNSKMLVISTHRYPKFNPDTYESEFDIVTRDEHGVLFVLKN
ncbi:hypothetical protein [Gilvimarinus polysaccharolyticus]|uniref:hypothetical protein n=1 Tax=Gilvimarinus polysaccharolyticus TaxID=863921 RepID=UPI0012FCF21B|nr:hypothetical protein [Gilvimarinus polysaccharolyticus]